jgi:hypothetical protein
LVALIVTTHVLVWPLQAPPHPLKVEPVMGVAVNVTVAPVAYTSEQSLPQAIPAGLEVTVPLPFPWRVTVSVTATPKVAVTD